MKYIDADKLKAEIERRLENYDPYYTSAGVKLKRLLSFINSLQQKPKEEICSKCEHHHLSDDCCYYPYGGMQSSINENGVYECTGFCEKEQEQLEVDFEKELKNKKTILLDLFGPMNGEQSLAIKNFARHFYELGLKQESINNNESDF